MNSIKLLTAGSSLFFSTLHAQEQQVPSLRSLVLNKSAKLLHKELPKPQSPAKRTMILDYWE